jgi:hypothetical protein
MPLSSYLESDAGLFFCGSQRISPGAPATGTITFPAFDVLFVLVNIVSYGGADVASLQFGSGAGVDTAANYWSRYITAAAGGVVLADVPNAADTMVQLGIATTLGRSSEIVITNPVNKTKVCSIHSQIGTASTAVGTIHLTGAGEWNNNTQQITQMKMLTHGGLNMGSGSGFSVFGRNF